MKKLTSCLCFLTVINCLHSQNPNFELPKSYSVLKEIYGDLDKDGINEKVVIYNTSENSINEGIDRELIIYKRFKDDWNAWKRSTKAIRNSAEGGMMGDPFQDIEIKNGVLCILHAGGSRTKWNYTEKYRYQNKEFELIGYTSFSGGPCNYWETVDFNVSTGRVKYSKENEDCETGEPKTIKKQEESFKYFLKKKRLLQNKDDAEVKIITPKYKVEIYL